MRRLLQCAVAFFGLVPVCAGLAGVIMGPAMTSPAMLFPATPDSHYRYLSGLLLGIGLCYWSMIPHIENDGGRFRLLTVIVFIGGLSRLVSLCAAGLPDNTMLSGLAMELVVTPSLALWQYRVEKQMLWNRVVRS